MIYRILILVLLCLLGACAEHEPVSASGVGKATVKVPTQADGLTTEQANVRDRLVEDNRPGAIKHLYVISPYSGQVLLYSTVRGKVTSGGKRLSPTTVSSIQNEGKYIPVNVGGDEYRTSEVLQDDGTYGSSSDYLFWWDTKGVYHQHFVTGGQIVHVSSEPIAVKSIILNLSGADEHTPPGDSEALHPPVPVPSASPAPKAK